MSRGGFFVDRAIWDHPDLAPSEFSEREAFIWMISEAAWKPHRRRAGRVSVDLDRGQLCASLRFLAEAWGWSKSRVERFLKRLENRDMIGTQSGTGQLVITLCNYDKFQSQRDTSGTRAGRKAGHERDTSGTNENKDNKDNKYIPPKPPKGGGDRFDEFWQEVPRKVNKGHARKAWAKAVKTTDPQTIIDGMKRHAKAVQGQEAQYIPHPSTWLNGERWADEVTQISDYQRRKAEAAKWL